MKLNWGSGIALLYSGFVIGILTLVVMSSRQKVDLVTENYYEEELGFQKKIDKIERTRQLKQPLLWGVNQEGIQIRYPEEMRGLGISGKIKLYCPADNGKDTEFSVQPDSTLQQLIPASKLRAGRYQLQIDWQADTATYWNEGVIVIQ